MHSQWVLPLPFIWRKITLGRKNRCILFFLKRRRLCVILWLMCFQIFFNFWSTISTNYSKSFISAWKSVKKKYSVPRCQPKWLMWSSQRLVILVMTQQCDSSYLDQKWAPIANHCSEKYIQAVNLVHIGDFHLTQILLMPFFVASCLFFFFAAKESV